MKSCQICGAAHNRRKYCSEDCRLESKRITARKWNRENKERHAEHQRDHKARDLELFRKKERQHYIKKISEQPGYFSDKTARRNAAKLSATPRWLTNQHKEQISHMYSRASILTELTGILHTVDHIEPLQGKNSCGLHVPWNLQVLTGAENSSKSNNPNKKMLYMLCGQSGVGKTTLISEFADTFNILNYDKHTDKSIDSVLLEDSGKPTIIETPIKISTMIKKYESNFFVRPIFLIEPLEEVISRINGRSGKMLNAEKRYNRVISLSKRYAYYSGNTEQVRLFLNELKKIIRDRHDSWFTA